MCVCLYVCKPFECGTGDKFAATSVLICTLINKTAVEPFAHCDVLCFAYAVDSLGQSRKSRVRALFVFLGRMRCGVPLASSCDIQNKHLSMRSHSLVFRNTPDVRTCAPFRVRVRRQDVLCCEYFPRIVSYRLPTDHQADRMPSCASMKYPPNCCWQL